MNAGYSPSQDSVRHACAWAMGHRRDKIGVPESRLTSYAQPPMKHGSMSPHRKRLPSPVTSTAGAAEQC